MTLDSGMAGLASRRGSAAVPLTATVVICVYTEDRWERILAAVHSVRAQTVAATQLLLVIDHNPRLLQRLRQELPEVRSMESDGPRGLSGARNTAVRAVNTPVLAFLDDDAEADPGWLGRLLQGFADPTVVGVGGSVRPTWVTRRPMWFPEEFAWVVGCTNSGGPVRPSLVRNLNGGCSAMLTQVVREVGGYHPALGRVDGNLAGCEETELSIRIHQHYPEARFLLDPSALISHFLPAERAHWRYFRRRCLDEGRSKARVSVLVGTGDSLSAERRHLLGPIPQGIAAGVQDVFAGDYWGAARAGTILAGVALTCLGYATECVLLAWPARRGRTRRGPR